MTVAFKTEGGYEAKFETLHIEVAPITLLAQDALSGATPISFFAPAEEEPERYSQTKRGRRFYRLPFYMVYSTLRTMTTSSSRELISNPFLRNSFQEGLSAAMSSYRMAIPLLFAASQGSRIPSEP